MVEGRCLFFSLPESAGLLLAGGSALNAQGLVTRPTDDLDFFAQPGTGNVTAAAEALTRAAESRNWSVGAILGLGDDASLVGADVLGMAAVANDRLRLASGT